MRLPNGYGGISKMSGKRRKPWRVRVTDKLEGGKQTYKNIGYYATRKEALDALAAYNNNPNIFDASGITFAEVYDLWSERKYQDISQSNINGYKASYALCDTLKPMRMQDIKTTHLQDVADNCGKNYPSLRKLKVLFGQIFEYAMQNDIVDKNYAKFVKLKKDEDESYKIDRTPFTEDEIATLWDNLERNEWIDTILIQIYTGVRIGELLAIKSNDVNLAEKYMRGGSKTEAGKNRVIPLHERILPLVQKRLESGTNLLITKNDAAVSYYTYRDTYWSNVMEQLGMEHRPHDCRHTFASRSDTAGLNKLCIKRIMGHKSTDITDKVYTHKDIGELIAEVNKIK